MVPPSKTSSARFRTHPATSSSSCGSWRAPGLLHREKRVPDTLIDEQLRRAAEADPPALGPKRSAPQKPATRAPASPSTRTPAASASPPSPAPPASDSGADGRAKKKRPPLTDDQIRAAHRRRMGRDFYAFIGLPSDAPKHSVDRKCKGLARRWRLPGKQREAPRRCRQDGGGVARWRPVGLANADRRSSSRGVRQAECSGASPEGRRPPRSERCAPSPTSSGPAEPPPGPRLAPAHEKARKLMDQGKHKEALSALKEPPGGQPIGSRHHGGFGLGDLEASGWKEWRRRRVSPSGAHLR